MLAQGLWPRRRRVAGDGLGVSSCLSWQHQPQRTHGTLSQGCRACRAGACAGADERPDFLPMFPWYSGTSADMYRTIFDLAVSLKLFLGRFDMRTMQARTARCCITACCVGGPVSCGAVQFCMAQTAARADRKTRPRKPRHNSLSFQDISDGWCLLLCCFAWANVSEAPHLA